MKKKYNILAKREKRKKESKYYTMEMGLIWVVLKMILIRVWLWLWWQAIGRQSNTAIYRESRSPCWGWTTMRLQQASQRNSHHFIGKWAPKTTKLIVNLSSFVECSYCSELNIYTSSHFCSYCKSNVFKHFDYVSLGRII